MIRQKRNGRIIGKNGEIIDNFRRVSVGWKEPVADSHYKEGDGFHTFRFEDKEFAVGLCGDLWDDANVERMKALKRLKEARLISWTAGSSIRPLRGKRACCMSPYEFLLFCMRRQFNTQKG